MFTYRNRFYYLTSLNKPEKSRTIHWASVAKEQKKVVKFLGTHLTNIPIKAIRELITASFSDNPIFDIPTSVW